VQTKSCFMFRTNLDNTRPISFIHLLYACAAKIEAFACSLTRMSRTQIYRVVGAFETEFGFAG
jgi:hypothetical protein